MRTLTLIQARLGSTRLPGKTLMPLGDATVLTQMLRRVARAKRAGRIVVATTTDAVDDAVVAECERHGFAWFRGHPTDLLDRHYQALLANPADAVVKIPSDCPLIDPAAIDRVLGFFQDSPGAYDFVSNLHPQSYPDGNDVEVMTAEALATAWREAEKGYEREHTTPFLWDNPDRFRLGNVSWETGLDYSKSHRWVLDYPEDYEAIRTIFDELYPRDAHFGIEQILALLERRPDIRDINARYLGDGWYNRHADELRTWGGKDHGHPAHT